MNTRKETLKNDILAFKNLRILIITAIFAAMSLILGKFLQIPIGETIRISFENLPILLSGICFGPIVGLVCGTVADLVGCMLYGYAINPIITVGAASIGFFSGLISHYIIRKPLWLNIAVSVVIPHVIGSLFVKTLGFYVYYGSPYWVTFGSRAIVYSIIAIAEFVLIFMLFKSNMFTSQLRRLVEKK